MNRLTEKMWNDYFMNIRGNSISNAYSRKLGKLEDIEEDLGCPLDVVFKALKEIYYEDEFGDLCQYQRPRLYYSDDLKCWCWKLFLGGYVLPLKDYKKSWFLKKDRSE